jgi:predicted DNA-binding transcriptional regulator YafY
MNRIDRLTAILIQLQTKKVVKAEEIADRFEISLRTVYRDVKALMEAGVPIGSEAGKGYFIVDGYHLPPVMFTQSEASSLMMAGKLVEKMTDKSIQHEFDSALNKIRAVLHDEEKEHLVNLQAHIEVRTPKGGIDLPVSFLTDIQKAVVSKEVLLLDYFSSYNEELTKREVEPIGLFYYSSAWHLIAWCRMRNGYRDFRADRIRKLKNTGANFDGRNLLSLKEYLSTVMESNREMFRVVAVFEKQMLRFVGNSKYNYGFVSEEESEGKTRMTFLTGYLQYLCRWLLTFGQQVEIESPEEARDVVIQLIEELNHHYRIVEEK